MTKYEKYKKMTEYMDKLDKIYAEYIKDIEKEYLQAIVNDEEFENKLDRIEKAFDNWEEIRETVNDMCFEIVEKS